MLWSLIAGIAGAAGAFCVLLAFGNKGSPPVVMSIVFGGAPIVTAAGEFHLHPPANGWGSHQAAILSRHFAGRGRRRAGDALPSAAAQTRARRSAQTAPAPARRGQLGTDARRHSSLPRGDHHRPVGATAFARRRTLSRQRLLLPKTQRRRRHLRRRFARGFFARAFPSPPSRNSSRTSARIRPSART